MCECKGFAISSQQAIHTLETVGGKYSGFRRAHARGVGFSGLFIPNGKASIYTKAPHLTNVPSRTIIRFSDSSINPNAKEHARFAVKGLSVQLSIPQKQIMNLSMSTIPISITKTPEDFIRLIQLLEKDRFKLRKKLETLMSAPNYKSLYSIIRNLKAPKSYALPTYHSIHAFWLVSEKGEKTAVKFEWVPDFRSIPEFSNMPVAIGDITLEDEIQLRVRRYPVRFKLFIQIGDELDPVDDCSILWPFDRKKIEVGTLYVEDKLGCNAESILFDPTVLPQGVECTNDPLLWFRSLVYKESKQRRDKESMKN